MAWLIGYTLASMAAAFVVVRIFDYLFSGVTGSLVSAARFVVFALVWTAVTVRSGMRSFTRRVRQLRQGNAKARSRIESLTKAEKP